jgi:tetratricopeptide (TPR) repeat protein
MRDINWQSRKEIADEILSLRNAMNFSAAIDVCLEATKRYPNNYFYPKIAGDLCYELHDYEAASHLYIEFLKHIPNIEKFFADFANRYDRLKRVWSKDRISEYASAIMLEIKRGCIENQVKQYAENLIKTDLPASITLSQQGNEFLSLLNNDNKFNALVTLERYLERNQSIELISILDKVVIEN